MYGYLIAGVIIVMLALGGYLLYIENGILKENNAKLTIALDIEKANVAKLKLMRAEDQIRLTHVMQGLNKADTELKEAVAKSNSYRDRLQEALTGRPKVVERASRKAWNGMFKHVEGLTTND